MRNEIVRQKSYELKIEMGAFGPITKYVEDMSFTDSFVSEQERKVKNLERIMRNAESVYQENLFREMQKSIDDYWEAHPEEKSRLEAEKLDATNKRDELWKEMGRISGYQEISKYNEQINSLQVKMESLGIFKGKEKKQLQAEIDALREKKNAIRTKIDDATSDLQKEIDKVDAIIDRIEQELSRGR